MRRKIFLLLAGILFLGIAGCDIFKDGDGKNDLLGESPDAVAINLNGGAGGDTGLGGNGGQMMISTTGYFSIHVLSSGEVDASFAIPEISPQAELGETGWIVTEDTVVESYPDHTGPGVGEYYLVDNADYLYHRTEAGYEEVSGLKVAAGRQLTLGLNAFDGSTALGCEIYFTDDLEIAGRLVTKPHATEIHVMSLVMISPLVDYDRSGLELAARQVFIRQGAEIDLSGIDAEEGSNDNGGDGGCLYIFAEAGIFNSGRIDVSGGDGDGDGDGGWAGVCGDLGGLGIDSELIKPNDMMSGNGIGLLCYSGMIINQGPIEASGGNGANGGHAGVLTAMVYQGKLFNTAPLTFNGGDAEIGSGGQGGAPFLFTSGGVYNSGRIQANGGDGMYGPGGDGGVPHLIVRPEFALSFRGKLVNRGEIEANGGLSVSDVGGDGGGLALVNNALGNIINKADITMNGGDGDTVGGDGGAIEIIDGIEMILGAAAEDESKLESIDVRISGKITMNGGNGKINGGSGGGIAIINASEGIGSLGRVPYPTDTYNRSIYLVGYKSINVNGGDGGNGGMGGLVYMFDPYGEIANTADIKGRGGLGRTGLGGDGGMAMLYSGIMMMYYGAAAEVSASIPYPYPTLDTTAVVGNKGDINLSGGDGWTQGGNGGVGFIGGDDAAGSSAKIVVSGGNGIGPDASGGNAAGAGMEPDVTIAAPYLFYLLGEGFFVYSFNGQAGVDGEIIAKGGQATGSGTAGFGGYVGAFAGEKVVSSADYYVNGGNADSKLGQGGDGGMVYLFSSLKTSKQDGMVVIKAGEGFLDGLWGGYYLDGVLIKGRSMMAL